MFFILKAEYFQDLCSCEQKYNLLFIYYLCRDVFSANVPNFDRSLKLGFNYELPLNDCEINNYTNPCFSTMCEGIFLLFVWLIAPGYVTTFFH